MYEQLQVLDLFSGIGGFSLGLENTGLFKTVAFCEVDPFCRSVLANHWPGVPIYDDIRMLCGRGLVNDGIGIDIICGGFPCQDISLAGGGAGIDGAHSGLWWEMFRLVDQIRPKWVIIENVPALRGRGLDRMLWAFTEIGYDAEWHCIPVRAPRPRGVNSHDQPARFGHPAPLRSGGSDYIKGNAGDTTNRQNQKPIIGMGGRKIFAGA